MEYVEKWVIEDVRMRRYVRKGDGTYCNVEELRGFMSWCIRTSGCACVDCVCNLPSFFATVFVLADAFNGDLNQWDVAKVTTMQSSKSIRILENDLL
jgi:hypothetical protein